MERMWRKVNHSFGGRSSKTTCGTKSADTAASAGAGFCDGHIVTIAVAGATTAGGSSAGNLPSSTATGRRLAASGQIPVPPTSNSAQQTAIDGSVAVSLCPKSLSQHVLHNSQASSDRRRRRRRKSRQRRSGVSCVGGGGADNMSSSGGFYTIKESSDGTIGNHRHCRQQRLSSNRIMATSAPSGTIMMYPNINRTIDTISSEITTKQTTTSAAAATSATPDISLRQRAVAKLRMFNFHLNWDLHMTHCKPCGPRIGGGGSGNIIMRRLCRNRRHEDNELYRSNSFKFERFERKECIDELTDTMKKQIAICDDYSLPVDFVKKRPSSFDPCLAEALPTNPGIWAHPSPQTEFISLSEPKESQYQSQQTKPQDLESLPPAPLAAQLSTLPTNKSTLNIPSSTFDPNNTLPSHQLVHIDSQSNNSHSIPSISHIPSHKKSQPQISLQAHPPLPNTIRHASIKLIEGYSDPKDSKRKKKPHHKRGKRRVNKNQRSQHQLSTPKGQDKAKRPNCSSDSSGPKSSDDENNQSIKVPELNSPDSISDDLVHPLPSQLYRSPRKLVVAPLDTSKRNPSPYYYSDLLKSKDNEVGAKEKENKNKSRKSTVSEPPQLTQPSINVCPYRKSTSLDAPENKEHDFDKIELIQNTPLPASNEISKRYSFTEEGVHIIRCDSPTTSTSEESDCSECQKRRQWHARALALVRKTCNIQPINVGANQSTCNHQTEETKSLPITEDNSSMPPHKLFGPAICACVAPTIGEDIDEFFRPRSIFYVHPQGVHECSDCVSNVSNLNSSTANVFDDQGPTQLKSAITLLDDDEMSGRTRQLYETAFDCKIAKSDDDLDEVDRITNHSVLFQPNSSSGANTNSDTRPKKNSNAKTRLEGKRLKNSKNHAIQEQSSNSGGNASGSGSPLSALPAEVDVNKDSDYQGNLTCITTGIEKVHIRNQTVDQQTDAACASTSQLPIRGYTPSPPSTAPLPIKFPGKHDRFLMNSIKSAPNLPSSNPAHPRLRDLRLPLQSSLRQHHQQAMSIGTSNENSLTDSAYVNPPSSTSRNIHNIPSSNIARVRDRPRSFVIESGRVLELRKSHVSHRHHVGNGGRRAHNYSSTESIATSSSGGSMESLHSSTSEGNRSTSSSESRNSTSLSSHSSESGSSSVALPLRAPVVVHSKLHILSPISDKSSQEPASELSEQNKTQHTSPEEVTQLAQLTQTQQQTSSNASASNIEIIRSQQQTQPDILKKKKPPPNKTLLHLADEIIGSDSGISLHSREDSKLSAGIQKFTLPKLNFSQSDKTNESSTSAAVTAANSSGVPQDLHDLPFDMPKISRKNNLQQEGCTSGSATSVDLGDLPFDMPKLRRRLRTNQIEIGILSHSTESSGLSQASSSHSMRDENKISMKLDAAIFRQNLTLNLNEPRQTSKFGSLDLRGLSTNKELNLNIAQGYTSAVDLIDISIPLERQGWYHGAITRIEAESTLRPLNEGSFLVRNCESTKQDYSLSLKGAKGFMHMRIQRNEAGQYILGQFSRPFEAVPDMIRHFCLNRLPVRGAEHMCLIEPVIVQLL